jgi:hypothetical protein
MAEDDLDKEGGAWNRIQIVGLISEAWERLAPDVARRRSLFIDN